MSVEGALIGAGLAPEAKHEQFGFDQFGRRGADVSVAETDTLRRLAALEDTGLLGGEIDLEPDIPALFLALRFAGTATDYRTDHVSGCGITVSRSAARLKAAAECLETLCFRNSRPGWHAVGAERTIDLQDFRYQSASINLPDVAPDRIAWTTATDLVNGDTVAVPAQLVWDTPDLRIEPQIRPDISTSGMAFGPVATERAQRCALFELFERDAVLRPYYSGEVPRRLVALPARLQAYVDTLRRRRLRLSLFQIVSRVCVPTVCAICVDEFGGFPAVTTGTASRSTFAAAAEKAICESLQSRPTLRGLADRTRIEPTGGTIGGLSRALYWADPAHLTQLDPWLNSTDVAPFPRAEHRVDADEALAKVRSLGWRLYRVDMALPEIASAGFEVVRLLCPDLLPCFVREGARPRALAATVSGPPHASVPPHPFV